MEIYAEPYIGHEIEDFVKRRIGKSSNNECAGLELYGAYKKWCQEYNTLPKSRNKFYDILEKDFIKVRDKKYGIIFLGVRLK
ncbi:primase-like DNA-binding domain-containing protein [Heyndrickxia oleronia]|jgi:phage/plasmid-associated DNA primase|uniref:primase-like DNA-binding domain-containing protein n=1 Tax=Heyndrickxia oleronia TaxID=38875 RepID=UPI003F25F1AC